MIGTDAVRVMVPHPRECDGVARLGPFVLTAQSVFLFPVLAGP